MEQAAGLEIETGAKPIFEEWGIAELMGHRVSAGKLTEAHLFGRIFLRIDIPQADGSSVTQMYGPEAIYGITFTTEDVARSVASDFPIGIQNARIASYLVRDEYDPDAEPEVEENDADGEDILQSAAIMGLDPRTAGERIRADLAAHIDPPDLVDGPSYTGGGSA
jgi:hypothetical protein